MKTRPILFSTAMVQAILEGRKTQTRRIIKPQPILRPTSGFNYKGSAYGLGFTSEETDRNFSSCVSKIQKGDILWVRETYTVLEPEHCEGMKDRFYYKASHHPTNEEWRMESIKAHYPYKWKPSIFMPKSACRIFLEVTNVRVEKLQDISEPDAVAEGVRYWADEDDSDLLDAIFKDYLTGERNLVSSYSSFRTIWLSINGEKSWDANPWVWVYDFKKVKKPEDFIYGN